MHLTYANQIIYCMCSEWMSASRSAAKLAYTLKKEQLDAVVGLENHCAMLVSRFTLSPTF